jgi:hypothetical protein
MRLCFTVRLALADARGGCWCCDVISKWDPMSGLLGLVVISAACVSLNFDATHVPELSVIRTWCPAATFLTVSLDGVAIDLCSALRVSHHKPSARSPLGIPLSKSTRNIDVAGGRSRQG